MATIAIASAKGGCGKTTVALLVGTELALESYRVALLDCDLNQHATAFGEKASIDGFRVVPAIDEGNILAELRKAEADSDVVLIDLPGGSSTLALKALQRSNFVLVPCQKSVPDVKDARKTIGQIDDAAELTRAKLERALIWSRVPFAFESGADRYVRENAEALSIPRFTTALMDRAAFREMHITGKVPRQKDPKGPAATNVSAITTELLSNLERLTVAA